MAKFTEEQLENMSDEEFLKLEEDSIEIVQEEEQTTPPVEESEPKEEDTPEDKEDDQQPETEDSTDEQLQDQDGQPFQSSEEEDSDGSEQEEEEPQDSEDSAEVHDDAEEQEEEPAGPEITVPEGVDQAQVNAALDFHKKITAPFKADGKDFEVRSPEDAIRLMQQGVNYSRRMAELKPMKQFHRMLIDNNLNDVNKLSFLIDLSKGNKGAIQKLLQDNKIDTMDLDTETENKYQANNYAGSAQDNAFRDALDTAMTIPEGQALVREVSAEWDDMSKDRLKQDPSIIGNLVEMKRSGIYERIVKELQYQRSLGYLAEIPFLQAFDQVGEAMAKAGVVGATQQTEQSGMAPLQASPAPVASGGRKVTAPKKPKPNPHLSSTPPSQQQQVHDTEPSYDNMSDEDFLKMAPPS